MDPDLVFVLIAGVSLHECRLVESSLKETGLTALSVEDAEAARRLLARAPASVLVIDSGLLEVSHDSQWRELREAHPRLGIVVRCLIPRGGLQQRDGRTFLVRPEDEVELRRAVGTLVDQACS